MLVLMGHGHVETPNQSPSQHCENHTQGTLYEHIESLWAQSKKEMAEKRYEAWLEPAFKECLKVLPWWKV